MESFIKEYGPHKYNGSEDKCTLGCGCYINIGTSGGPIGLDPYGKCPNNPVDGKRLGGDADRRSVVEQRIHDLELRVKKAEGELKKAQEAFLIVCEKNKKLADKLSATNGIITIEMDAEKKAK